jgi:hypothetical protein
LAVNDYLWDRSGRDEEVERLERLLGPLALRPRVRPRKVRTLVAVAMAAAMLGAISLPFFLPAEKGPSYLVDGRPLRAGAVVDTSRESRTIELAGIGSLVAERHARVRVLSISERLHKLRLDLGTVHAKINWDARPRLFQVETPATTCVDLGCKYTLTVDRDGSTFVHVLTGRVAFHEGGREVYVPAGAFCRAWPGRGSGTPMWDDASPELVEAVRVLERSSGPSRETAARAVVRGCSRAKDTLTIWHLLQDEERGVVQVGLDALGAPPEGVTVEAILRRDPAALEAWRDYLEWNWH